MRDDIIKLPQLKIGDEVEIDGYKGIVIDVVQDRRDFFEKFTNEIYNDNHGFTYLRKRLCSKRGNLKIEIEFKE